MNPLLAASVQTPDFLGAIERGRGVYQQKQEAEQANALRAYMADNGAAIMRGDQNALAGLAQYDPRTALAIQGDRQAMDLRRQESQASLANDAKRLQMLEADAARKAAEHAAQMDAMEREKTVATLTTMLPAFEAINTPEAWDAAAQNVSPDLVGKFAQKADLIAMGKGLLQGFAGPKEPPAPLTDEGKRVFDQRNGYIDPNAPKPVDMKSEADFRKEFTSLPTTKTFQTQVQAFNQIATSAKQGTPASDMSLVYGFMKMLDPGSVVRESEFAMAANAAPLLERLGIDWNKVEGIWSGEGLTPRGRADFLAQAEAIFKAAQGQYKATEGQWRKYATEYGFEPDRVIPNFDVVNQPSLLDDEALFERYGIPR